MAERRIIGASLVPAHSQGKPGRSLAEKVWASHLGGAAMQAAALLPIAAVYLWFALVVRGAHSFSGDEPHYLAISQGFWLYHTVDQHRVLYHHDFFAYYPRLMSSHSVHRGQRLYPLHYPGLPLALLPGFALAGAAGAQVTTVLIGVLALWRALRLAARTAGPIAAVVAVGVLGLSAPFVLNASAIYPDLLSGLLLVLAYEATDAPRLTTRRALALGLLLAACPWVHVKLLVIVAIFMAWAVWKLWRPSPSNTLSGEQRGINRLVGLMRAFGAHQPHQHEDRSWGAGTGSARAPRAENRSPPRSGRGYTPRGVKGAGVLALGLPLLSLAGLMLYNLALYGSPSPAAAYNGPTLFTGNALTGLAGQLFAQAQGALGTAPFALLALPGAVVLWRRDRATAFKIFLATVPFWLVTLTYRDWWGGDAPPLRYLLPMLPLWAVYVAAGLAALRTASARIAVGALAVATLALTLAIPAAPRLGWPLANGQGALLLALGQRLRLPLTAWLPAFEPARTGSGLWHHAALIAAWAALLLAVSALVAWRERAARRYHDATGNERGQRSGTAPDA